jgi:predicted RNase H-like nuclease
MATIFAELIAQPLVEQAESVPLLPRENVLSPQRIVAGVDACSAGWLCIARRQDTGAIRTAVYGSTATLLAQRPEPEIIAIDIPIGLSDAGPRQCDERARQILGYPRSSRVFSAPIRPALDAETREEACQITMQFDQRRVGVQAWTVFAKVRQLDQLLRADAALRGRVIEVHPEICFSAWNRGHAMRYTKKRTQGRTDRRGLVEAHFGPQALAQVRQQYKKKKVTDDDIHDAFAALWTAERFIAKQAHVLPEQPPCDAMGLPMAIWF